MKKIITLLLSVALCFSLAVPAFATANGLDEETKADYYAEYIKIAQEVNQTLSSSKADYLPCFVNGIEMPPVSTTKTCS